jgi:hypothetical protein
MILSRKICPMEGQNKPQNAAENGKIEVPETAENQAGEGEKNVAELPFCRLRSPADFCANRRQSGDKKSLISV